MMRKVQPVFTFFFLFFVLSACSNVQDNETVEETILNIATQYIEAEYSGNREVLLRLTAGDARKAVESGELDVFHNQYLDKIVEAKVNKISDDQYSVVVTVSASPTEQEQTTHYFENITISKRNDTWFITKVDRDQ